MVSGQKKIKEINRLFFGTFCIRLFAIPQPLSLCITEINFTYTAKELCTGNKRIITISADVRNQNFVGKAAGVLFL